jgi:hypothetical protein
VVAGTGERMKNKKLEIRNEEVKGKLINEEV